MDTIVHDALGSLGDGADACRVERILESPLFAVLRDLLHEERLHLQIGLESILVEEDGAAAEAGNAKVVLDDVCVKLRTRPPQRNDASRTGDMLFDGSRDAPLLTRVAKDTETGLLG